jgi:hypothetical protein
VVEVLEHDVGVIRAILFDVGETLVDESREYGTWADWLGVPRDIFSSVFLCVSKNSIRPARRLDSDIAAASERRAASGADATSTIPSRT